MMVLGDDCKVVNVEWHDAAGGQEWQARGSEGSC